MPTENPARARSRLEEAVIRAITGARVQRHRLDLATADAPRLSAGSAVEVVDLRTQHRNDLDYYAHELARLREAAREVVRVFGDPAEVRTALNKFDATVPHLRAVRNPLTHPSDDSRLDNVAWSGALVRLLPGGQVHYLVDPRYEHHEAAEALATALLSFLARQPAA